MTTKQDVPSTESVLEILNAYHPSITFTVEIPVYNFMSFLGMELLKNGARVKSNTGLYQHYQSHVDYRSHYAEPRV